MSKFRNKIIYSDNHKDGNKTKSKNKIEPIFFLQKQDWNQIKIVEVKQDNSCKPLYIKVVIDAKRTFVKLNQRSQYKENPYGTMEQNFVITAIFDGIYLHLQFYF